MCTNTLVLSTNDLTYLGHVERTYFFCMCIHLATETLILIV